MLKRKAAQKAGVVLIAFLTCIFFFTAACAEANAAVPSEASSLDLVSITVSPDDLWNAETGLFTEGESIDKSHGLPFTGSVYSTQVGSKREATLEYYPAGAAAPVLSESVKISLVDGAYSLDLPQKSLHIAASDGSFDYPLFSSREYSSYNAFVLSNAEGDGVFTRIARGVQTTLLDTFMETEMLIPAWKPVAVYINGEYWGHYNMQQPVDARTVCQHEGADAAIADEVTIVSASGKSVQGDAGEYVAVMNRIAEASPNTNPDDRAYLDQQIDVENYLDWLASVWYLGDSNPGDLVYYQLPGGA